MFLGRAILDSPASGLLSRKLPLLEARGACTDTRPMDLSNFAAHYGPKGVTRVTVQPATLALPRRRRHWCKPRGRGTGEA